MILRASSNAANASDGVRDGPPMASIASQKAPAPIPSSKRPPERTSSDAASFAIMAGTRIGKLATSGKIGEDPDPRGTREQVGHQRPRIEKAPLVRVVLDTHEVEPERVRQAHGGPSLQEVGGGGNDADPEFDRPAVVAHRSPLSIHRVARLRKGRTFHRTYPGTTTNKSRFRAEIALGISLRAMWKIVALAITIVRPNAESGVAQGRVRVRPGTTKPIAATTSATPMNCRNHALNPDIAIASAIMAGGLMKSHPWKRNSTARKTCKTHASAFIGSLPLVGGTISR